MTMLKYFISCNTPKGPPSWLAPLSLIKRIKVLSSSPMVFRSRRADRSGRRCARGTRRRPLAVGGELLLDLGQFVHGSTPSLRGASSVNSGTIPNSFCRANHLVRATSQALVIAAAVTLEVLTGRLVGRVRRAKAR